MQIIKLSPKNLKEIVGIISKAIKEGKVVVLPTDTVYGLIVDARSKKAIDKLFKIKNRRKTEPVPIFVQNIEEAKKIAEINEKQEIFLKKSWPGKTTARLLRSDLNSQKVYGVDKKTIALRIPKHELIKKVLELTKAPLSGTSANISGRPSAISLEELMDQFGGTKNQPDLIVDAGKLKSRKASKIVDLTINPPKILRP